MTYMCAPRQGHCRFFTPTAKHLLPDNGNLLIASLPARDRELLSSHLEPVTLRLKDVLTEFDAPVEHVYFPESGMCSLLSVLSNGKAVEVASAGREGMVGMPLFFRTERLPERCIVQLPGRAHRMSAESFRKVLRESDALNDVLHRYAGCIYSFASLNTACGRKHQVVPRLARWLLHSADQSGTHSLKLTHEFGAMMLGVRRSSITVAAGELRKRKLIDYTRSSIDIVDRAGLIAASCECYATISGTYARLLGVDERSVVERPGFAGGEAYSLKSIG